MSEETPVTPDEPAEGGRVSRRKFLGGVAGAGLGGLAIAGILAACGGNDEEGAAPAPAPPGEEPAPTTAPGQTAADTSQPIVIGSAYPVINAASDAEQMERGSGLAIEEVNNAGGVAGRTIEHEIVDMNSFDAESVSSGMNDLVSKEVDAVIFGYHNVFDPNDILAAYGAPFLNASTSIDQVTRLKADPVKYKNIFQADPSEVPYGLGFPPFLEALVTQGLFSPPAKTIYIIEGDIAVRTADLEVLPGGGSRAGLGGRRRRPGRHRGRDGPGGRLDAVHLQGEGLERGRDLQHPLEPGRPCRVHEGMGGGSGGLVRLPPVRRVGARVPRDRRATPPKAPSGRRCSAR